MAILTLLIGKSVTPLTYIGRSVKLLRHLDLRKAPLLIRVDL